MTFSLIGFLAAKKATLTADDKKVATNAFLSPCFRFDSASLCEKPQAPPGAADEKKVR